MLFTEVLAESSNAKKEKQIYLIEANVKIMNTKEDDLVKQINRMIQLNSHSGFIDAFFDSTKTHRTFEEAYNAIEIEYESYFGITKYSSYDSFRKIRDRQKKRQKTISKHAKT